METNIILAGVGGQGIVSISYVIDMAALEHGLEFKQAEVHGMSQRGGAVSSHLRISDRPIHSDLVPKGRCDLVLAIEPLESLRYVDYLSPTGTLVSGTDPFINIGNYGEVERYLSTIASLPSHVLVSAERLARQAGTAKAQNMVLLGAASSTLKLPAELLESCIRKAFARKGEKVQDTNVSAFRFGVSAAALYHSLLANGLPSARAHLLIGRLQGARLQDSAIAKWKQVFEGPLSKPLCDLLSSKTMGRIADSDDVPSALLKAKEPTAEQLASIAFGTTTSA